MVVEGSKSGPSEKTKKRGLEGGRQVLRDVFVGGVPKTVRGVLPDVRGTIEG